MHMPNSYNEIESFILKWTFTTVFAGVILLFTLKILMLLGTYVASGKIAIDLGAFIWKVFTSIPGKILPTF